MRVCPLGCPSVKKTIIPERMKKTNAFPSRSGGVFLWGRMQISVKADIKSVTRKLTAIQKKQIPFAVSKGLNDTAFDLQRHMQGEVGKHIDRPTPFTRKGFMVRRATKAHHIAEVYIPGNRWKYMKYAVDGGTAPGLSSVPVKAPRNAYGSMRRNYLANAIKSKSTFSGTVKGKAGVYRRTGRKGKGGLKTLAVFKTGVRYPARFDYPGIGGKYVRSVFLRHMREALARALATAR